MASFLAVHRHSVLMLFAVVALTLFACSGSDSSDDPSSSSYESSSSLNDPNNSSSSAVQTYAVTYNANGGTDAPVVQTKTHNSDVALSSDVPTRIGYAFNGWNTKEDGTGDNYAAGASYTANAVLTLYAQWTINTYTVTYNANGGTDAPAAQTKTYGVDLALSDAPARTGYAFSGWNTEADGTGDNYAAGANYTDNDDVTLYAQWILSAYTVTFDANGGDETTVPTTQQKAHGTDLTLSNDVPTRTGYTFYSWNTKEDGTGDNYAAGASYAANASVTLYAKWTINTYTVTFNSDGGTQVSNQEVDYNSSATEPANPTKTGNAFAGWFNGAAAFDFATKITADLTLTAKWEINTYTVTYNANSGTDEVTVPDDQTKIHGDNLILSTNVPTRTGYTFYTWNTEEDGSGEPFAEGGSYIVDDDIILYAQWKINTYAVTYNANGGTDAPAAQTKTYGIDLTLSNIEPTRKYYTFSGWNTQLDGNGIDYAVGGSYKGNAPITLYAQWAVKTHTLTVSASNGGTVKVSIGSIDQPLIKTYDAGTVVTIEAIADNGYVFSAWEGDADGWANTIQVIIGEEEKDLTITANFIEETGEEDNHTIIDERDGQTYKIVSINTQIWMAENLNYAVEGSICYGDNSGSDSQGNCEKYGRMYNWAIAMNIDASFNTNTWSGSDGKHQGICPEGWHIPSTDDWNTLLYYVGGKEPIEGSNTIGKSLKSENWNGTDDYGFAALPGGLSSSTFSFSAINSGFHAWTTIQTSATAANSRVISSDAIGVNPTSRSKVYYLSIRCLKN